MLERIPDGVVWVRAWDFASTEEMGGSDPDWTVGCKFGFHQATKSYIIGHINRDRVGPGGVLKMVKATAEQDGLGVPIFIPQDPAQAGKVQVQHYASELAGYTVKWNPVTGTKTDRAGPFASQAEAGNVYLYRADWNDDYLDEVTAFPTGSRRRPG